MKMASRLTSDAGTTPNHFGAQIASYVASPSYAAGSDPRASVVVSTYGRAQFLLELIEALSHQEMPLVDYEVVVVDNGSDDTTWDFLEKLVPAAPISILALRLPTNRGAGGGRDVGVSAARGEIVAFTDDDCVPTKRWLPELLEAMDRAGAPEGVVIAQGATFPWEKDARAYGPWARSIQVEEPSWLFETCNVAYRRADLIALGGFSRAPRQRLALARPRSRWQPNASVSWLQPGREALGARRGDLVRPFGEDALLGWAVTESGATLVFSPRALVHHRHIPTSYASWLAEHCRLALFPELVEASPYGRMATWKGPFLSRRSAAFDLMAAGILLSVIRRSVLPVLASALPWALSARREAAGRSGRRTPTRMLQLALGDLVGMAALAWGSLRARSPLL